MNIYKKIYDEAYKEAIRNKTDIRQAFYRILEEEHLLTNKNKDILYNPFCETLESMINEKRDTLKEAYPVLPRNKKNENYLFAKKILKSIINFDLIDIICECNQEELKKYGEKTNIEELFKNRRGATYSDEEDKIIINEKIKYHLLSVFDEMLTYENGKFYVKLLKDSYVSLEYFTKKEIAKINFLSVCAYEYKLVQAINFFGDILESKFNIDTLK